MATNEREEIKGMTKQEMAIQYSKEGGNHLKQESKSQRTTEGIDGGLHPAVDGQSLGERCVKEKLEKSSNSLENSK